MSFTKLCPSAPLDSATVFEQRLEKKLNDEKSFNKTVNILEKIIAYIKEEKPKPKKHKNQKKPINYFKNS